MRVRDLEKTDIPQLLEIVRSVMPERVEYVLAATALSNVLIALADEIVAGFLMWNREFFGKPFCWLLVTAPAYRRQRFASTLLEAFEAGCRAERVYTSTNQSNAPMHRLLAKRGYTRRGEVDVDPGDPEVFYSNDSKGGVKRGLSHG